MIVYLQTYNAKIADCYSLGVCMFEMLTKKMPFSKYEMGDAELIKLQRAKSYSLGTVKISCLCKDLLDGLLEPTPQDRINIHQALMHNWFKASAEKLAKMPFKSESFKTAQADASSEVESTFSAADSNV